MSTQTLVIMGAITQVGQIMTDLQRSHPKGHLNCQRFLALLTGVYGSVSTLAALMTYAESCHKGLPTSFLLDDGSEVIAEWAAGTGFTLMVSI